MTEYKVSVINEGTEKHLLVKQDIDPFKILTVDTNIVSDLPDYSEQIKRYYTEDYWLIPSINYKEGDTYLNEHVHFWTVVAHMVGQSPDVSEENLIYEKALFSITCPIFTGEEDFYLESLSYYLMYYNKYNTLNITQLLEVSIGDLKVNNFYNSKSSHLYCFYNDTFTEYTFDTTDKFIKNTQLIESMSPILWYNKYYTLRRDVLLVGGVPFLVNGEQLTLDIVNDIFTDPLSPEFFVEPTSDNIFVGKEKEFSITYVGGLSPDSIEISVSDTSKINVVLSESSVNVTAVATGSVVLTVSSTDITKIQEIPITVSTLSTFGRFKANNLGISPEEGRFVNLDTTTGELTFQPSNGTTIVPCGLTNSAPVSPGTMRVFYLLKKRPNGSSGICYSEPGGYLPVEGQPFVVSNGFIAAPGSGEEISDTTVVRNVIDNQYIIGAERDITDIELVSQYDLGN